MREREAQKYCTCKEQLCFSKTRCSKKKKKGGEFFFYNIRTFFCEQLSLLLHYILVLRPTSS